MRHYLHGLVLLLTIPWPATRAFAAEVVADVHAYQTAKDILYRGGDQLTDYMRQRCRLDVYYPSGIQDFSTVVWFHGGGLRAGARSIPAQLKQQRIGVVAVNYRLHPDVKSPAYVQDAAAAVAWVFKNIESYGGSTEHVFVSGHSAGGYLTSMVGLDKRWLAAHQIDADRIAGLVPFSGHTITHLAPRQNLWAVHRRSLCFTLVFSLFSGVSRYY